MSQTKLKYFGIYQRLISRQGSPVSRHASISKILREDHDLIIYQIIIPLCVEQLWQHGSVNQCNIFRNFFLSLNANSVIVSEIQFTVAMSVCLSPPGNPGFRRTRDFRSKSIMLKLQTPKNKSHRQVWQFLIFQSFCVLGLCKPVYCSQYGS